MEVFVNIECALGLPSPDTYASFLIDILDVDESQVDKAEVVDNPGSYCYLYNDVHRDIYEERLDDIKVYFTDLFNRGLIQYFYIGEFVNEEK